MRGPHLALRHSPWPTWMPIWGDPRPYGIEVATPADILSGKSEGTGSV